MKSTFQIALEKGQKGENIIERWLQTKGFDVLPIYPKEGQQFKGPRYKAISKELVAPDFLLFKNGTFYFGEAKHKTVFSWYRKLDRWETGIDLHHFRDYLEIQDRQKLEVWMFFLHRKSQPDPKDIKYCQGLSPVGLFGQQISILRQPGFGRESKRYGYFGMIYWPYSGLKFLAELSELGL